jgi:hypothetical protein
VFLWMRVQAKLSWGKKRNQKLPLINSFKTRETQIIELGPTYFFFSIEIFNALRKITFNLICSKEIDKELKISSFFFSRTLKYLWNRRDFSAMKVDWVDCRMGFEWHWRMPRVRRVFHIERWQNSLVHLKLNSSTRKIVKQFFV